MNQRIPLEQASAKIPTEAERKAHELTHVPYAPWYGVPHASSVGPGLINAGELASPTIKDARQSPLTSAR